MEPLYQVGQKVAVNIGGSVGNRTEVRSIIISQTAVEILNKPDSDDEDNFLGFNFFGEGVYSI